MNVLALAFHPISSESRWWFRFQGISTKLNNGIKLKRDWETTQSKFVTPHIFGWSTFRHLISTNHCPDIMFRLGLLGQYQQMVFYILFLEKVLEFFWIIFERSWSDMKMYGVWFYFGPLRPVGEQVTDIWSTSFNRSILKIFLVDCLFIKLRSDHCLFFFFFDYLDNRFQDHFNIWFYTFLRFSVAVLFISILAVWSTECSYVSKRQS